MPREPLPPPLPPETRTIGQLVAETLRFYRGRFWHSLAIGLPFAVADQLLIQLDGLRLAAPLIGAVFLTTAYVAASALVVGGPRSRLAGAFGAGVLAYVPFALLAILFILPGLAWLAFVGLVVPVMLAEGLPLRAAFRRATQLARADYVHALGALATLTIVFFLCRLMLFFLLRGFGSAADSVAIFLADLVLAPVVFLGAALLYFDQAARLDSAKRPRRSRGADLHPALEPDRAGRPDPQVESGPLARGEP